MCAEDYLLITLSEIRPIMMQNSLKTFKDLKTITSSIIITLKIISQKTLSDLTKTKIRFNLL